MMKKSLLLLTVIALPMLLQAQSKIVSGKVTSMEDGSILPGVNVVLKGTATGTVTDVSGNYSIEVADPANAVLVFTFIGLKSQEVSLNGRSSVDVQMETDAKQLGEVVVTGYGDRDRSSFTGSAAALSRTLIENKPVATIEQVLQGNVAGLQLSNSSGTPGSVQNIRIRGVSSITASNEPLFVIDGIPVVSGTNDRSTSTADLSVLSSINPNDIESISVLKDASAAALYGARGANGVIIITTKRGSSGKPVVTLSAQTGYVSKAVDGPKMLNAAQWEELYYEAIVNAGRAATIEEAKLNYPSGWDGETDTNWKDVVTNDDAMTHTYDLSMNGGNDKSRYFTSVGYFQQDGTNIGSNFKRYSAKLSFTNQVTKDLSLSTSFNGSFVRQSGQVEGSAYFSNPDAAYLFLWPMDKPYNDDGTPNLNLSTSQFNPIYIAENNITRKDQTRLFNSTTLDYSFLKNFKFTSQLGLDFLLTEELYYNNRYHGDGADVNGDSYVYNNRNFNWVWKNMLNYNLEINHDNKLDFKLVYEAQKNQYYTVATGGYGFAADGLHFPTSVGTPDYASGYTEDWSINSVLGIVNYTFRNNVFVDATYRREGNSKFAPDSRWGTFYSVGASWVLSDESFMEGVKTWLSMAKVRASYGKTGNAGSNSLINKYQSLLSYSGSYNGDAGAVPNQYGNMKLSWENSNTLNFGVDFGLLNRVNVTVDYFRRNSYDLLLDVPLSYTTGFSSQTQNVGEMENKGVEITLNTDVIKANGFTWNININLTSVKNEVTKLPRSTEGNEIGITSSTQKVTQGQAVYSWYFPTWAGVNPDTGSPLWYKSGTSGETVSVYSQAGKSFHGSAAPTFYGGFTNRFEYKGAYLSASLYYSSGNNVYDSWASYMMSDGRFTFSTGNAYASQFDRWQKPGDIAKNPKNVLSNTSLSSSASTRRLYDGDFLRLRDVTLGYNLPVSLISKIKLSNASIYLRGSNVWTWVKDDNLEYDPEVKADGFLSLQAPPLKSYVLGVKFSF